MLFKGIRRVRRPQGLYQYVLNHAGFFLATT
jgi:hypothetical protein